VNEQSPMKFATGDVIAKKYEISRFLGEGMSAQTYLAKHIASGKDLVIRFLRPNLVADQKDRERLRQLFERARGVRHEMLTRYGELGVHGDFIYHTEEFFVSESLRELVDAYVAEGKAFSLQEACQLAISVLEAVEVAHNAGIIHRNLKPENVLVHTKRIGPAANAKVIRTVKITGTGLAGVLNPTILADSFVSREDAPYLAPELAGFDAECGPQADIYSVGVMLYELLCGQRPMGTYLSPTQLREDLPEHVDDIVEIGLAHNPEDRYPTARDMINDIQRSFSLEMQAGRTKVSFRNILMGLGISIVLAVGVGAWVLTSDKPDPIAEAKRADDMVRRQVQTQNPLPDDALMITMGEKHKEMLYVPGGTFVSGRYGSEAPDVATSGEPLRKVVKVPSFYIDRYEFPNKPGTKPAVRVTWDKAAEACEAIGKRLCTELEWEKACKGPGNLIYAYADEHNPSCSQEVSGDYTLGDRKDCASNYGVFDLSSGLREWTSGTHPTKDNRKLVKGGVRSNPVRGTRCAFAVDESSGFSESTLGFRCCLNADGSATSEPEAPAEADAPAEDAPAAE
jgi:serine/threonine protein kinase